MRSIVWCGPTYQPTGYADEVRGMVLALHEHKIDVTLVPPAVESAGAFRDGLDPATRRILDNAVERPVGPGFIQVQHGTIDSFSPANRHAEYSIGRSMFETDSLPSHWIAGANALDELWVTGEFNRQSFAKAGVKTPMHIIPGGIDSQLFRPDVAPMVLPGVRGTVFLSVFEWRLRKGWDVLLRAWADAFERNDNVTLVLRTYPISRAEGLDNASVIGGYIDEFLRTQCGGRSRADVAPIVILGDAVAAPDLPSLYTAAHVFVLPTRGEGWGRPFMESMACGVPVIATNWSAHLAFLNNSNGYLIDVDGTDAADFTEVPAYAGQRWASLNAAHLTTLLQRVHRDRAEATHLGMIARRDMVDHWPWSRVAAAIEARLSAINEFLDRSPVHAPVATSAPDIVIEGPSPEPLLPRDSSADWLIAASTLSGGTNREPRVIWRVANRGPRPRYDLPLYPFWRDANTPVVDAAVHVTVLDARRGADVPLPPQRGVWIVDAGTTVACGVPPQLIPVLRDSADVVVVPGDVARAHCLAAGIADHRIAVIAPDIDGDRFSKSGAPLRNTESASFCFLLLGDDRAYRDWPRAIAAYERAFTADDDVLLRIVIPPTRCAPRSAFMHRLMQQVHTGRRHPRLPRIVIHSDGVHHDEIPSVYRSADVLLHPAPTTGSGRTVREALASGTVVIAAETPWVSTYAGHAHVRLVPVDHQGRADMAAMQKAMLDSAHNTTHDSSHGHDVRLSARLASPAGTSQRDRMRRVVEAARANAHPRALGDIPPATVLPLPLQDARSVVIVAHANWHSGMAQAIVRTYATAFSAHDDVTLALCLDPAQAVEIAQAELMIHDALSAANCPLDAMPDLLLVPDVLTEPVLHQLRAAASLIVAVRDHTAVAHARRANRAVLTSLDIRVWRDAVAALRPASFAA